MPGDRLEAASAAGDQGTALVVGLGGGGLPVFLSRCCGLAVEAVELDPVVVNMARDHFGFCDDEHLKVRNCRCMENLVVQVLVAGLWTSAALTWMPVVCCDHEQQ